MRETFETATTPRTHDVRELIPEFYYLPEFLCNGRKLDLGVVIPCELCRALLTERLSDR